MDNNHETLPTTLPTGPEDHPLAGLVGTLEQVVLSSEDDFMALGMNLQKVQMKSSGQRQKISAVMELFKADEETGLMKVISSYVQQSQQDTQAAQQTAIDLCNDLSTMLKVMFEIDKNSHSLEQAGLFLHVIGINTGIECSRYSQIESTFKVVAQDTTTLADQIHKATDILFDKSTQAKTEQSKTLQDAKKSIDALEQLARDSRQATEIALSKVSELIDYSISMVNEAEQMAVNISSEINRVVMGIQFHDNLRQRIEHVNDALLETAVPHDDADAELACNAFLSVELQKAQLDNLVGELDVLYSSQAQALGNIIQEVSGLETRLASMADEQNSQTSQENPVAVLLAGITSLERLNQDSLTLGVEISDSAKRAEQIVVEMNDAIKTTFAIANSVKINALNAIIKAAKFGRAGEALQVLAQGMVTVSKDTRQLVRDFNQQLEQLQTLTRNEQTAGEEQATAADFDSSRLQQIFQDFRSELQTSRADCQSLAGNLQKEQQDLVFIAKLKAAIEQYANQLGGYAASIQPADEALLAEMRASFGAQLQSRYTMNEERAIHHQLRQGDKATESPQASADESAGDCLFFDEPAATATAPATDVDLWDAKPSSAAASVELFDDTPVAPQATDDVELWDAEPAATESSVELFADVPAATGSDDVELWGDAPAAPQAEATDDVELWGDPAPAENAETTADSSTEKQTNKKEEDLGDNVELF